MSILGIDEVGRGPWAGPLVIGAVVLPAASAEKFSWFQQLADSKKLSSKKRAELSEKILSKEAKAAGVKTGLGWVSAAELDDVGLAKALCLAARRAVKNLGECSFSEIIIDGTQNFLVGTKFEKMVSILPKADAKIKEVSAASIIAKVARDNYMKELVEKYPEYGFEKHVGYGTKMHKEALEKYGPCKEHRKSFRPVAEMMQKTQGAGKVRNAQGAREMQALQKTQKIRKVQTTKALGDRAENIVAEYLKSQGQKILARNFKTKFYEIDIVSATKDTIYFTEVKYRKKSSHGNPFEVIDSEKQKQMEFAAQCFMQFLAKKLQRNLDDMPKQKMAAAAVFGENFQLEKWMVL